MEKNQKHNHSLFKHLEGSKIQLAITLGAVAVAVANLWILARIAPLAQDILVNAQEIQHIREQIRDINEGQGGIATKNDIDRLEVRLIRIENILLGQ